MKKYVFIIVAFVLALSLLFTGCENNIADNSNLSSAATLPRQGTVPCVKGK